MRPQPWEELTFDYSSVTESEAEFKAATCLCGSTSCRGSYLYFNGAKAFTYVSAVDHQCMTYCCFWSCWCV